MPAQTGAAQSTNLFRLEDLEDTKRTSELAEGDLTRFTPLQIGSSLS